MDQRGLFERLRRDYFFINHFPKNDTRFDVTFAQCWPDGMELRIDQGSASRRRFRVTASLNGSYRRDRPDLIVLDLGLPDIDSVDVCMAVRQLDSIPILVLSARGAEGDKVRALDAGADDYVTKPFGAEELLARIRASLRRLESPPPDSEPIVRGALVIDRARFRVLRDGDELRLTPKEFELLTYLAQYPGRVLTHRTILKAIWGPHPGAQPEHLRVLVGALRKKIEPNPTSPRYILTEPWVGYRFADL